MNRRTLALGALPALALAATARRWVTTAAQRQRISLNPTAEGSAIRARGTATIRPLGGDTALRVTVSARVPDGTMFAIYVFSKRNPHEPFWFDWITINGRQGSIAGVSPIVDPARLVIQDDTFTDVLTGTFG